MNLVISLLVLIGESAYFPFFVLICESDYFHFRRTLIGECAYLCLSVLIGKSLLSLCLDWWVLLPHGLNWVGLVICLSACLVISLPWLISVVISMSGLASGSGYLSALISECDCNTNWSVCLPLTVRQACQAPRQLLQNHPSGHLWGCMTTPRLEKENAGWTTGRTWLCRNCSWWLPAGKTERRYLLNCPSFPPDDLIGRGTELKSLSMCVRRRFYHKLCF